MSHYIVSFSQYNYTALQNQIGIKQVVCHAKKWNPAAQIAHFIFADTQANAKKTKRAIF